MASRLLAEQRKRLVASILGSAEQSPWWKNLSVEEQRAFRDKVLLGIGSFYDLCRDVIKVSNDDTLRNEHALTLIQQVHDGQRALERQLKKT